jgi:hypothetical protein
MKYFLKKGLVFSQGGQERNGVFHNRDFFKCIWSEFGIDTYDIRGRLERDIHHVGKLLWSLASFPATARLASNNQSKPYPSCKGMAH